MLLNMMEANAETSFINNHIINKLHTMGHLTLRLKDADAVTQYFFGLGDKEHIYDSMVDQIEFGISKNLDNVRIAEIILDNGDDFIIDCWEEDWYKNLDQAKKWYIDNELYESCPRIEKLKSLLSPNIHEK